MNSQPLLLKEENREWVAKAHNIDLNVTLNLLKVSVMCCQQQHTA